MNVQKAGRRYNEAPAPTRLTANTACALNNTCEKSYFCHYFCSETPVQQIETHFGSMSNQV